MKSFSSIPLMGSFLQNVMSPASFDLGFLKIEGPALLVIPALLALVLALVASFVWLYRDARRRRKSGLVAILFVLLTGYPLSFIWWFWLRPPASQPQDGMTSRIG